MQYYATYKDILGKIFTSVVATKYTFILENEEESFVFFHEQDCCEHVRIADIVGDTQDLVGEPVRLAEVVINRENDPEADESKTWTFYKFATIKGYVDVRWIGESNGYYSEEVNLKHTVK